MEKISSETKNEVIKKLSKTFDTDHVEYRGSGRFVVRKKYPLSLANGETTWLFKDQLFDEDCNQIPLQNEYNAIYMFISKIAVVRIRENIQFVNDRVIEEQKNGIIDLNGKELLPCVYDSIRQHGGYVDLSKDGQKKSTTVNEIISGDFDWDKVYGWA